MQRWRFRGTSKKRYKLNLLNDVDYRKDGQVRYPGYAQTCYNVDASKSVLKKARAFGTSYLDTMSCDKGKYITYFDRDKGYVVIVGESGNLIWYKEGVSYTTKRSECAPVFTSTPRSIPYTLNGENVLFFSDPSQGLFVWRGAGTPEKLENAPLIKSMTVHNERLFVTVQDDPYTLWFSDDLDPTNWNVSLTGAGFIKFTDERGKLLNLISFGGYLYIFREYGISRVSAYGEQTEFSITHLFTPSGRIYEETVILCGDRIMFCSSDGIFSFDGANAVRVLYCLDGYFKVKPNACAGFYDGKYYVSTYNDFLDESLGADGLATCVNNCILEYNVFSKDFVMHRGLDIRCICPVRNVNVVFVDENNNLCIFDNYDRGDLGDMKEYFDFYGKWEMPSCDLGAPDQEKWVHSLSFYCDGNAEITIKSEYEEKTFIIKPSKGLVEIPINVFGSVFSIVFKLLDRYMRIAKPTFIFS